jgi:hypothetical protein
MRMVSFYDIVQTLLEMINVILLVFSILMMMFSTTTLKHLLCVALIQLEKRARRCSLRVLSCLLSPGISREATVTLHLVACWRYS